MKLEFNLENLENDNDLYFEQFNKIDDCIYSFRTSRCTATIMLNLYICLDEVKKLDLDYTFCKDLFIEAFGYDLLILKYKLCEVTEYIEKSKVTIDGKHNFALHELIEKVFTLRDENDKSSFAMNYLEYTAYCDLNGHNYQKAIKSYEKLLNYMNDNIFLQKKIKKAHMEYKKCIKKLSESENQVTNNL